MRAGEIFVGLGLNISLLLSATLLYGLTIRRLAGVGAEARGAAIGLYFGVVALLGMFLPVTIMKGVQIDGRVVVVAVAAFVGGRAGAATALLLPVAYRLYIGGVGAAPGVGALITAAALGAVWHHRVPVFEETRVRTFLVFGTAVAAQALAWTLALPWPVAWKLVGLYLVPVMVTYPAGITLFGTLLLHEEQRHAAAARLRQEIARKEATEASLRESEARFRALAEHIQEVFWINDPQSGQVSYVSPAYEAVWGRTAQSLYDDPLSWSTAIVERHRGGVIAAARDAATGQPYDLEYEIERPDGEKRWIRDRAFPVRDAGGALVRVVGVAEDVTARKAAQDELRTHDERLAAIVEHSVDGLCVALEGRIMLVNAAFLRMLGAASPEGLIGSPSLGWLTPSARPAIEKLLETDEPDASVIEQLTGGPPGGAFEVRVARYGTSREYTLFVVRDISERSRMEEQLRQAMKMDAIGRLAGGIAHDFNNILGVILGNADHLKKQLGRRAEAAPEIADIIAAGEQASALTKQLLAFSRKQVLQPRVVPMADAVRDACRMIGRLLGRGVAFDLDLAADTGHLLVDPSQLQQVVLNLAVNARDAMGAQGRITVSTRHVAAGDPSLPRQADAAHAAYVLLSVADTGTGMDAATKSRLFEPFFTTKEMGKGTGLGLATVHGIVRQAGGFIEVSSELGVGTRFDVYFPAVDVADQPGRAPAAPRALEPPTLATVLVVEDGASLRRLLCRALQRAGHEVLEAGSGAEALEVSKQHEGPIGVLLTDVAMPGISGRVLAESLTRTRPEMKVVFMSGNVEDATLQAAVEREEVRLLQKPFDVTTLLRAISPGA